MGKPLTLSSLSNILAGIRRLFAAGYFHLVTSIICVQGLIYLSQFIIARIVGPADFGVVRSVEAVIGIAVILGSAGMPSLIIKCIAEQHDKNLHGSILGRFTMIAFIMGIVASLSVAGIGIFFIPKDARIYLWCIAGIVGLTASNRTILNYFQGIKQFQRISVVNLCLSLISLVLLIIMVHVWGLHGWIFSRYFGETLFLLGGLLLVRKVITFRTNLPTEYNYGFIVPMGMMLSLSLIIRMVIDNLGLFILGYMGQSPKVVGFFGLGALIVTGAGLLPGAAISIMLPRLAEGFRSSVRDAWALYLRTLRYIIVITISLSLIIFLCTPVLAYLLGKEFTAAIRLLNILLLCIPFRSLTSLSGTYLVVLNLANYTLYINLITVILGIITFPLITHSYGAYGLALLTVMLDIVSSALYIYYCYRNNKRYIVA